MCKARELKLPPKQKKTTCILGAVPSSFDMAHLKLKWEGLSAFLKKNRGENKISILNIVMLDCNNYNF